VQAETSAACKLCYLGPDRSRRLVESRDDFWVGCTVKRNRIFQDHKHSPAAARALPIRLVLKNLMLSLARCEKSIRVGWRVQAAFEMHPWRLRASGKRTAVVAPVRQSANRQSAAGICAHALAGRLQKRVPFWADGNASAHAPLWMPPG
jgi:hypothetical protein